MKKTAMVLPTLVAATGVAVAGVGLVSADASTADTSSSTASSTTSEKSTAPPSGENPQKKDGGVITTDSTVVSSVTSAVQAKYSGATIDRVAKLPDGSYLAFSRKSDDSKVIVSLSSSYEITSAKELPAGVPKDGQKPSDIKDVTTTSS